MKNLKSFFAPIHKKLKTNYQSFVIGNFNQISIAEWETHKHEHIFPVWFNKMVPLRIFTSFKKIKNNNMRKYFILSMLL